MRKRILALTMAAIMAASMTACGSGNSSTADTTAASVDTPSETTSGGETGSMDASSETLTVWMPTFAAADGPITDKDFWERELKALSDETGCTINVEIIPWDSYEEKYLTGISSNEGPDVGYMYMEMFYDYIKQEQIVDISPYFTAEEQADYIYYDLGAMQNGQYGLPVVVGNPRILIGNKQILEEAGISQMPSTWDEFVEDCKLIMEKTDAVPFVQDWGNPHYGSLNEIYWPYFWSAGGEIVDAEGNLTIDTPAGLEATQFLYDLRNANGILSDSCTAVTDVESAFKEGNTAFVVIAASNALRITDIDWDYTTVLQSPNGGAKTFVAADCLVMLNSAKNKELAAKAMKLITSTDVMSRFHKEVSSQPPITTDEAFEGDARFNELYLNESEKLQSLPVFEGAAALYDALYKNLQSMMLGDMTPEEVLTNTTDYYTSNIKE